MGVCEDIWMDPDPITTSVAEDGGNVADDIERRIEDLAEVDAPDAADLASDLASTLAELLDQVESV